jgi:Tannase and feruloyl esterase
MLCKNHDFPLTATLSTLTLGFMLAGCAGPGATLNAETQQALRPLDCSQLATVSIANTRLTLMEPVAAGHLKSTAPPSPNGSLPLGIEVPAHCHVQGKIAERTGVDGKPYAIGFDLRLPSAWNGRFFFQGGGGTDGVLRDATGQLTGGGNTSNALLQGYAVVFTDTGHLNEPGPNGTNCHHSQGVDCCTLRQTRG